jgi:hypothetical protein
VSIWGLLAVITVAGAVGGAVNALLTDNGFRLPRWEEVGGSRIWRPGWITNVIIGVAAAVVSWGLYGPYANNVLVGGRGAAGPHDLVLTLSSLVGAFLVGIGGSRYLTSQVEKNLLKATAATAAAREADPTISAAIATATPAAALRIADRLPARNRAD